MLCELLNSRYEYGMIIYYNFSVFPRISTKGTISRHPAEGSGRLSGYPEAPVLSTAQNSSMEMFCMEFTRCFQCMEETRHYPCPHCGYDPGAQSAFSYALRPGTILNGKYAVGTVLGQGGFGITYVGWDLALENKVAVKEYFPSAQVTRSLSTSGTLQWYNTESARVARESGKEMFLKEARKMSRVSEIPQVVRVRDLFQQNETAYIVMDFIEGKTLKDHLKKTGPLSWERAREIFLPAIEAMKRVHKAGLIHRDLSPDNLMLQPDGTVKILDLGAAKDLNINTGASSMQVAKGGFSPLEQYTQQGGSGTWTDVYAMAATIYYTLTGAVPTAAVDRIVKDTLRWDLPQLTALPEHVLTALQKAMVLQPDGRTRTMAEFAAQLTQTVNKPSKEAARQPENDGAAGKAPDPGESPDGSAQGSANPGSQAAAGSGGKKPSRKLVIGLAAAIALILFFTVHIWGSATCTEPAKCRICGKVRDDALGHSWTAATCDKPKTCSRCGETTGKALGHDWLDATCEKPETCSRCGKTTGKALGHGWLDATCEKPETCSRCGKTTGKALGHNWAAATCKSPKTCRTCGKTEGSTADHQWVAATYSSPKYCSVCKQKSGDVKGYLGKVSGTWESAVYGGQRGKALHLSTTIDGMRKMTVNLKVEMNSGARCYDWTLYGRVNGVWKKIGTIHLKDGNGASSITLTGDGTEKIDWIGVHPTANGGYSWTMWLYITDAQQN